MTDTTLNLGDFQFARFEIPEQIPFGGEQKLNVHELIGGKRVIDVMGEVPRALEWSGFFVGSSALERARYVDGLRKAGKALSLTWSELAYTVIVKTVECTFQRFYRLPYRIVCEVVSDDSAPVTSISSPSPEQLINDDLASANTLSGQIGDSALSGLMGSLSTAISSVSDIATAAQGQINTILAPIAAVRSRVSLLMASASGTLLNVGTVGGLVPGNPVAQQVYALTNTIGAVQSEQPLVELDRTMGRMQANLGALNSGTKTITVTGGNLYQIAAEQYGDPMQWTTIAQANKLTDPNLTGIVTLAIPPFRVSSGGVLNA